MTPECPVKDVAKVKKEIGEDAKSKDGSAKGSDGGHYKVRWEGDSFEMWDHSGEPVEVLLESGCPTVTIKTANHLIEELEKLRVAALKAGDPANLAPNVWKWLKDLREMWPEVPDELIARVVPTGRWTAESVPLNRRQRQKIAASSSVVLHLFSGPDQSWWRKRLDSSSRTVICVDKMADSNQDLLADQLTSCLAEVCEKGVVDVILGGPPCRKVSKLRLRRPGPPPLRARSGPERFALEDLSDAMRELAWNDAVLWMRQLWLYTLACQTRSRLVLSLKEHPRDFEEYKSVNDTNEYPSFYAWPEWQEFRARFGMKEVRLDMGALGHQCRKPTTLGTNIPHLCSFEGLSDSRDHGQSIDPNASIEARVQQSRGWAAWPERFKEEIVKGILWLWTNRAISTSRTATCFARPRTFFKGVYYVLEGCGPQRCHDFECRHLWTVSPGGRLSKKGKVLLGGSMPFQGHGGAT